MIQNEIVIGDLVHAKTVTGGGFYGIVVKIESRECQFGPWKLYSVKNRHSGKVSKHTELDVGKAELTMEVYVVIDCEYRAYGVYSSLENALKGIHATKEEIEEIFKPMAGVWKIGDPAFVITKCTLDQ